MKKISKIQASKRVLQIAKHVAMVQASNNKLTPLEIAKVQKTVGMILAAADADQEILKSIEQLDNKETVQSVQANEDKPNGNTNQIVQQLLKNKGNIVKEKNKQMKNPLVKEFLSEKGIKITKPMKVGKFFEIIKELLLNFESIVNPQEQID